MKEPIKFSLAIRSLEAGKPSPNEDNWFVDANLSDNIGIDSDEPIFVTDRIETLSEFGALMVVADGMGGMNAGEIASEIARRTAGEMFAPGRLTADIASTHKSRCAYMSATIIETNKRILADQKKIPEHNGMGSTMIMAWLCHGELSVTWLGDSRAYIWRKQSQRLQPISKDHSYVQTLVNENKITYEQAFSHPQGNIVVKSLGDTEKEASPESAEVVKVDQGDIILLCSDGLSGVLFDHKAYTDGDLVSQFNIEDILTENQNQNMSHILDELFRCAELSGWYDNVTAILCHIEHDTEPDLQQFTITKDDLNNPMDKTVFKITRKTVRASLLVAVIAIIIGVIALLFMKQRTISEAKPDLCVVKIDSLTQAASDGKYNALFDTAKIASDLRIYISQNDSAGFSRNVKIWEYKIKSADTLLMFKYLGNLAAFEKNAKLAIGSPMVDTVQVKATIDTLRTMFLESIQNLFMRKLADNHINNDSIHNLILELKLTEAFSKDTTKISNMIESQIVAANQYRNVDNNLQRVEVKRNDNNPQNISTPESTASPTLTPVIEDE